MKKEELTANEMLVLKAVAKNAKEVGDEGVEFIISDIAHDLKKSQRSIQGTISSLQKKRLVRCANGDSYFDGEITELGLATLSAQE